MNIKKTLSIVLAAAMMCMILSGCMAEDIDIKFNSDGSGSLTVGAYFSDDFITSMGSTPEAFAADMVADSDGTVVAYKTINGMKYTGASQSADFSSVAEISMLLADDSEDASHIDVTETTINGERCVVVDAYIPSDSEIAGDSGYSEEETAEMDLSSLLAVTMSFDFPNGVTEVTGLDQSAYIIEGNKITVDLISSANTQTFKVVGSLGKDVSVPGKHNFRVARVYRGQFTDVPEDAWYAEAVATAYTTGIVAGTSESTYNPEGTLTIAQIITMAARFNAVYNGNVTIDTNLENGEAWYQPYVDYAIANKLIDKNAFTDYNKAATRAEMAYVIHNCVPQKHFDSIGGAMADFNDVNKANIYYEDIMALALTGITVGTGDNNFSPEANVTRAQAAVFMVRLFEII